MKDYMKIFAMLFASLMLTACGGGSSGSTTDATTAQIPAVKLQSASQIFIESDNRTFSLETTYVKNVNDNYSVRMDFLPELLKINDGQCQIEWVKFDPESVVMNGGIGSTVTVRAGGKFLNDCTPTDLYAVVADVTTTKDGESVTERTEFVSQSTAAIPETGDVIDASNYQLSVVPGVINATDPQQTQAVTVFVSDKVTAKPVADIPVYVKFFDPQFGSFQEYNGTTSSNGSFVFTYVPPPVLPTSPIDIQFDIENASPSVAQTATINFATPVTDKPIVVISDSFKQMTLTQNSENRAMEVQVFVEGSNTPYTQGNVKVTLPPEVLEGRDVGSFEQYSVPVGQDGKAVFNYTGPQDLKSLIDAGITGATFTFYHEENPDSQATVTTTYELTSGYIPANYILTTSSADGKQTMNLETLKTYTLYLKDDLGTLVENAKINTITIRSQNTLVGKLVDSANGDRVTELSFSGDNATNSKSFSVETYKLSGLLPIEITVDFTDANGDPASRTITMNIVVFSGPPTAMSISYVGVEQDSTVGKYIEKFAVTVTDAYNNPVNTKPFISAGAIVEYAVDGSSPTGERSTSSPRLWHGTLDPRGTLEAIGGNKAQFKTASDVFNYVDINNDRLVVFGAGYVYEALGKWDLESVSNQLLELKDDYYGITRTDLGFAVGHNNRQDLCSTDQREYVGTMKSDTYQIDENGNALIEFAYDYHLTGKDIMVWVNLTGFQADNNLNVRIGEAQKHTLRGNGLVPVPSEGYTVAKGTTATVKFEIHHENAPEWYQNAKFAWAVKAGSTCGWTLLETSNAYDARDCRSYPAGYLVFSLTAPDDKDCTFAIDRITTATEFTGVSTY